MKTFTTYAEKKAKQFFNLLQGYTKGIRITAILILLLMGVSNVSAWDIGGNNVIFYYANTGGWSGINMHYWGGSWSSNQAFTKINNTNIYYYKFDNTWTDLSGIKFNQAQDNWDNQSSDDITGDLTSSRYWKGNETSSSTTLANLNGTAEVISRISTGGTYTEQVNAACVATVSGYTLSNSATSASTTNASTGSASYASIKAAYGSTITYKSNTPTGYTFKGFSTTNSTSLPTGLKSSGTTVTASGVGGTANATYYAYYLITQYTITYTLNGGSGTMTPTTYTVETETFNLPTPTKADFDFEGWYTTSDFSGSKVTQITKGSTGDITLYAKWTAQAQPDPTHEIYLVGEFNWDAASENMFEQDPNDPNIYTLTKHFDARDRHQTTTQSQPEYEFKLQVDDIKYTVEDNTDANTKDQYKKILQYTRQSKTKILSDGTAYDSDPYYNLLLQADFTGDYVFTYNVSTKELTVEHPTYTPEASYIVGDFSDGATGTDALPIDGGAGHDWTEEHGQSIGTDPNEPICFELGKNSTWEFKIKINGVWYGAENVNITEDGEYILTDDYAYMSERNCTITTTDVDGEYCFSYKVNDDGTITLIVGYPEEQGNENVTTVYLKPNDEWKAESPFSITYSEETIEMEALDCNGEYYVVEIPAGIPEFQFKNNSGTTTLPLSVPADDKVLYDMTSTNITHIYLKPNSNWLQANAKFEAHFWGNGDDWVTMEHIGNNIYRSEKKQNNVLFNRIDPNNGYNKWSRTKDLLILSDGTNLFEINKDASTDYNQLADGKWYTLWDNSKWTTYTAPTYDVTINITGKGSVVIDGTTYTSNSTGTTTQKKTGVEVNTNINVTSIEPADRWAKSAATIIIGNNDQEELSTSHSICGPTTINVTFEQTQCVVHFELQLPTGTVHPAIDDQVVDVNTTADKPQVDNIDGYIFGGWYTDEACSIGKEYDFTKPVTKDITLYAKWVPYSECIFFKDNLNWDNIYIYTFSDNVWHNGNNNDDPDDDKGVQPKVNRIEYGKMTQIGYTDIYYYALTNLEGFNHIAFSDHDMHDYDDYFHNHSGIYRSDRSDKMQLFIPQKEQTAKTHNNTEYYSEGIWMKYNDKYSGYDWSGQTGGSSNWSDKQLTSDLAGGYSFTAEVELTANQNYEFKIKNLNNTWYGNTGTMTQDNCTDWWFTENTDNAKITPTVTGTYIFTVYLGDGKVMVSLDYPLSVGDYRLAYKDSQAGSFHPGHYIKKRTKVEEKRDTVSFFVVHDKTPEIQLQECTNITSEGIATWETIATYSNINSIATATTVYNFILKQTNINGTHARSVETSETHLYTGDYYIRTDAAAGGWKSFRQEGNKMTYNSYADEHEDFDHYFCEWVSQDKGLKNVSYTVANDYSYCISDTLLKDVDEVHPKIVTDADGKLPTDANGKLKDANVRWGWDSKTNKIRRAYIAGSGHKKDRFLVLEGNASLQDVNGNRFTGQTAEGQDRYKLTDDEVVFEDMGNWIYQIDVKANKDTKIDLTALYDGKVQYFKGGSEDGDEMLLISTTNDNEKYYKIRIIYDFKTNHLISAWLPEDETITTDEQLGADMMIIRHNQEKAEQLNFNPLSSSLTKVGTAYAVMTFDKYFLNNKDKTTGLSLSGDKQNSDYARALYWISFPFDVKLSEVFGFGEYGDYWIMEYYDGAARAANGLWADTDTYWRYITNKNYILQKGQGYVISLNLNKMGFTSSIFANTTEVSLYFPSHGELGTITGELPTSVEVPAHECTIERENGIHKIYDSHWNVIGVPGFADIENVNVEGHIFTQDSIHFYYEYLPQTNEYRTRRAGGDKTPANFQTMYSYMVQYYGGINWSTKTFTGSSAIAARRTGEMPSQYDLRLELTTDDQLHDQTFILLDEDKRVTAEYDVNLDLTKIMNKNASIYTLAGEQRITLSGNTLPMAMQTVPVGVRVATAGEYTFRMPDGTDGISVILVDNQTGTHTNMLMNEYTVTLDAGTIENRFYLVVDPDRTATSVENVGSGANGDEAKGVEKFLIDGKLFIRTADGIFDAKGQRL